MRDSITSNLRIYKRIWKNKFSITKSGTLNLLGTLHIPQTFLALAMAPNTFVYYVLPKQTACEKKALQIQVYIQ